ncbi:MAG: tetratricopeptide repeat protein [Bacteroidia bacterium]|nr:tetratricopeptide repeat protein [Bacteroidia bacterium]
MVRYFKIIISALIFISVMDIIAQQNNINKLIHKLNSENPDTFNIELYLLIGDKYEYNIPDSALFFYNKALLLSQKIKNRETEARILNYIGIVYHNKTAYDKALEFYRKSLNIYEALSQSSDNSKAAIGKDGMSDCFNNIGLVYRGRGLYDKSIEYFQKSLKIRKELRNIKSLYECYNNIGLVLMEKGNYDKAIELYQKSLKICEEIDDKIGMSASNNNIGNIHLLQRNYQKSIEYYWKSYLVDEEAGNKKGMANFYVNIGIVYFYQSKLDKSIESFQKSYMLREEIGDKRGMSESCNNIGIILKNQGKYKEAADYYRKSAKICNEIGDKPGIAKITSNIAGLYMMLADSMKYEADKSMFYYTAVRYADTSLIIAREIGVLHEENDSYQILMFAWKSLGNMTKAFYYAEKYILTKDSLFNEEKTKAITEMEIRYETEKKEQQIKLLNNENELKASQLAMKEAETKKQKVIIFSVIMGLMISFIFTVVIFNRFRLIRRQRNVIRKQKAEVDEKNIIIEQKNKDITDSIRYAKKIQEAILISTEYCERHLPQHFIFLNQRILSVAIFTGYMLSLLVRVRLKAVPLIMLVTG